MYLQHWLFIDHIPASEHVMGSCYLIDSASPMHALVFNIPQQEHQRIQVAKEIEKLVDLLHEVEIPYNVMINRGSHGLRCIVVPRTSTKDRDLSPIFDMACVEIGGQFPIKSENEFCKLTHDLAFKILKSNGVDDEKFNSLVEKFKTGHA
uniref:GDP-D-glucose phosphorylase 1 n=1 Tax=Ciona savignyi TaxID=51511 RepID=H2ZA32_CIOSA